jgi:hypothetical protein
VIVTEVNATRVGGTAVGVSNESHSESGSRLWLRLLSNSHARTEDEESATDAETCSEKTSVMVAVTYAVSDAGAEMSVEAGAGVEEVGVETSSKSSQRTWTAHRLSLPRPASQSRHGRTR